MHFALLSLLLLPTLTLSNSPINGGGQNGTNNYLGSTPAQRYSIPLSTALSIITSATAYAASVIPQNVAIVDPSGLLVAFARMDNAYPGSIDIAIKKARTVSLFNGQFTSADFYNSSQPGGPLYGIEQTNNGLVVFGGGLPIYENGYFIGAIGVSGGTVPQDVAVATAGVAGVSGLSSTT